MATGTNAKHGERPQDATVAQACCSTPYTANKLLQQRGHSKDLLGPLPPGLLTPLTKPAHPKSPFLSSQLSKASEVEEGSRMQYIQMSSLGGVKGIH